MDVTTLADGLTLPDCVNDARLLNKAIDGEARAAYELLILDFLIERIPAREVPVSGEVPHDVVGQAGEHLRCSPRRKPRT